MVRLPLNTQSSNQSHPVTPIDALLTVNQRPGTAQGSPLSPRLWAEAVTAALEEEDALANTPPAPVLADPPSPVPTEPAPCAAQQMHTGESSSRVSKPRAPKLSDNSSICATSTLLSSCVGAGVTDAAEEVRQPTLSDCDEFVG